MSLIFYYSPQSTATPVHWTLEELGVPYEKVQLDIRKGDTRKPEFLKINPNGKVPVLVHNGVAIFESVAIQIYLGETFGVDKGLFPAAGPGRGEALKWLVWCNVTLGDAVSRYAHNTSSFIPAEQHNAKAAEVARENIHQLLQIADQALEGRQYLLGDRFMLPDLHLVSWFEYLTHFGIDLASFKNIKPWQDRCTARPAHARGV